MRVTQSSSWAEELRDSGFCSAGTLETADVGGGLFREKSVSLFIIETISAQLSLGKLAVEVKRNCRIVQRVEDGGSRDRGIPAYYSALALSFWITPLTFPIYI